MLRVLPSSYAWFCRVPQTDSGCRPLGAQGRVEIPARDFLCSRSQLSRAFWDTLALSVPCKVPPVAQRCNDRWRRDMLHAYGFTGGHAFFLFTLHIRPHLPAFAFHLM